MYKKKFISLCCLFAISLLPFCATSCSKKQEKSAFNKPIQEVEFDTSMGQGFKEFDLIFTNPDDISRYNLFKTLYEENLPSKIPASQETKIPKIIHQIWLGPKLPPAFFVTFQERWKFYHPDWEYHLWTESELDDINLDLRDIINQSSNYAEKSDIIRCELLEKFGGVYLDVDMEGFQSLDELHSKYDFYVGLEHPHKIATTNNRVWVGISIMAAKPGHPIIKRWKELIRSRWEEVNRAYTSPIERVINHTYFPFSMAVLEKYSEGNNVNIAFPPTYFYPLSPDHAAKRLSSVRSMREKIYDFLEAIHLKRPRMFSKIKTETIAAHYWGNTWLPNPSEQLKDLQHQVDFLRKELYRLQNKVRQLEPLHSAQAQDIVDPTCELIIEGNATDLGSNASLQEVYSLSF